MSEDVGLIDGAIVSKIFNLFGHDPPTLYTDRQPDGQTERQTDRWTNIAY